MARWFPEGTPTAARALCCTWGEERVEWRGWLVEVRVDEGNDE